MKKSYRIGGVMFSSLVLAAMTPSSWAGTIHPNWTSGLLAVNAVNLSHGLDLIRSDSEKKQDSSSQPARNDSGAQAPSDPSSGAPTSDGSDADRIRDHFMPENSAGADADRIRDHFTGVPQNSTEARTPFQSGDVIQFKKGTSTWFHSKPSFDPDNQDHSRARASAPQEKAKILKMVKFPGTDNYAVQIQPLNGGQDGKAKKGEPTYWVYLNSSSPTFKHEGEADSVADKPSQSHSPEHSASVRPAQAMTPARPSPAHPEQHPAVAAQVKPAVAIHPAMARHDGGGNLSSPGDSESIADLTKRIIALQDMYQNEVEQVSQLKCRLQELQSAPTGYGSPGMQQYGANPYGYRQPTSNGQPQGQASASGEQVSPVFARGQTYSPAQGYGAGAPVYPAGQGYGVGPGLSRGQAGAGYSAQQAYPQGQGYAQTPMGLAPRGPSQGMNGIIPVAAMGPQPMMGMGGGVLPVDSAIQLALSGPLHLVRRDMMGNIHIPSCLFTNGRVYIKYDYCRKGTYGEAGVTIYTPGGQSIHLHVGSSSLNGRDAHFNVADPRMFASGYPQSFEWNVELHQHAPTGDRMNCEVGWDAGGWNRSADCAGSPGLAYAWLPGAARFAARPSQGWFQLLGELQHQSDMASKNDHGRLSGWDK